MKIILKPMGAIILLVAFATLTFIATQNRSRVAPPATTLAQSIAQRDLVDAVPKAAIPAPSHSPMDAADLTAQVIENPDFAGGNATIPGWGLHKSADKRLHISGDTTMFSSAPSSVRVWTEPGEERILGRGGSSLFKTLPAKPGQSFTVSMNLCKRGRWNRAEIVVHLFDKNWDTNSYTSIASFAGQKDGEWKTYTGTLPVDDKTFAGVIYIIGDGEGTLNMDDLRITVAP